MKEVKLFEDKKHLVDSDEIKFKRPKPLSTIEVRVSTAESPNTRIDIKRDFVVAIQNFPYANAYLNLGPIPGKSETKEREHKDPDIGFIHVSYWFYKVELYHLGE